MRRVVISGIGLVTSLGIGTEPTWQGLIAGRSAIGPIRSFDASSMRTQLAGEVSDFVPQTFVKNRRQLRLMTRGDQFAFAASSLAMDDAHLETRQLAADRTGLFLGSFKEVCDPDHLLPPILESRNSNGSIDINTFTKVAYEKMYPLFFVEGLPQSSMFFLSEAFHIKGANSFFVGTADASAVAIGRAFRAIKRGEIDVALAGGFDHPLLWWYLMKLNAFEVTTPHNDLGAQAYRPYDKHRSGAIMGEGAACMILEDYESACKRNAPIYAEITGFGSGFDTYRFITPNPKGKGLVNAMTSALHEAQTTPERINYISAHGSGTKLGDVSEAAAIHSVFGSAASQVAASSIKPATGHLAAAAGALNIAVAALALRHQVLPPTLHLQHPDPDCQLDWVPNQAREAQIEGALALARGLEGQNVAVALHRVV